MTDTKAKITTAMATFTHTYYRNTKTIKIRRTPEIPEKLNARKNRAHRTVKSMAHLQQLRQTHKMDIMQFCQSFQKKTYHRTINISLNALLILFAMNKHTLTLFSHTQTNNQ